MNRIGIIGAMEEEVAMLKEQMKDVTVKEKAAMEFFHGTLNKKEVVVVRSGIGKVNAGVCVQILADDYQVDAVINTGIAGSLSMLFNCTLMAPHGGIFVLPTIGNPLMYAIAIFIGALVGCLILSFLKKPLPENVEEKKGKH